MEILHGPQPLPNRSIDSRQIHPLAYAIRKHWPSTDVDILPIAMSRTGTPHSSTITSLTCLLTLRTDPPDKRISKARLDTSRIIAQLHTHILQWMHHFLHIHSPRLHTPHVRTPLTARRLRHASHTPRGGEGVKTLITLWSGGLS
jgi:hypothetical protein